MTEKFEDMVERIARAWFEDSGPHNDFTPLNWIMGHPDDKDFARYTAAFVLRQAGIE
jgi:hypothetical protein